MDDLVTAEEAAELLGVTPGHIKNIVYAGHLRPYYRGGGRRRRLFKRAHLEGYLKAREKKWTTGEIACIAMQAMAEVKSLETEVRHITNHLGLRIQGLNMDELSVKETVAKVEYELEAPPRARSAIEIWEWAKMFYAIGEEYFEMVAQWTDLEEPWQPFVQLGWKLGKEAPPLFDKEVEIAYGYLGMGRRVMRQSVYFYVRNRHGKRVSDKLFPEMGDDLVSPVIGMAYPDYSP